MSDARINCDCRAPRKQQRVHQPLTRNRRPLDAVKLGVDESDVERGVVNHQRRVRDEFQKLLNHMGEQRLAGEELAREAMHREGFRRHIALGVDVAVKCLPRRHAVEDLDAADLDQPIAA
jgi:hypothetical protein